MNKKEFLEELSKLNIYLTEKQLNQLDKFYNLLISWNEKINLTTIVKEEDVYLKHYYDSLTLIKAIDLTKKIKVLDVGTGAGFPGIVLKIVFSKDYFQKNGTFKSSIHTFVYLIMFNH